MRQLLSIALSWLLVITMLTTATGTIASAAPRHGSDPQSLKELATQIPIGSPVDVKLHSKEGFRGQLVNVADDGITVKTTKGNKIEDRKVAFTDVKSLKEKGKGHSPAMWIWTGIGVFFVVLIIVAAAGGMNN